MPHAYKKTGKHTLKTESDSKGGVDMADDLRLARYSVRTDLAIEAREMVTEKANQAAPMQGLEFHEEVIEGIKCSYMTDRKSVV